MNFSFLHAADLHLGSPFIGLSSSDPELARRVASASREALEDLVTRAIELRVDFIVIAGDIYDGDWKDTSMVANDVQVKFKLTLTGVGPL